ncbi:MAG: DUF817 domain-containing protein [Chitinophagales bacterium]|nr:DUF817 domain-containing protein [Chitinophagales bacterium]
MQLNSLLQFNIQQADSAAIKFIKEFIAFGIKQALSCIFPVFIICMLFLSKIIHVPFLPRYDFLLLSCISMQAIMFFTKMETIDELLVICMFHVIGLCMEIFKVHMGSWSYPEFGYAKVCDVPLYSGFMYASVASYICQAWRRFDLQISGWSSDWLAIGVAAAIYANFFTHHFIYDLRYVLIAAMVIVFYKTKVHFTANGTRRKMPLLLSFFLIGFFVWVAENIATFFGAWQYTYQHAGWQMVVSGKLISWFMMIVISIIIVIELKFIKGRKTLSAV